MSSQEQQQDTDNDKEKTTVNIIIPTRLYKTAYANSILLGYDSFEEYLCELIRADVESELDSAGSLEMKIADEQVKKNCLDTLK